MTTTHLTVEQALEHAIAHHQAGRLTEAEQLYAAILRIDPHHFDAGHMLGLIAYQVGRHQIAVDLITKAIKINPNMAACHSHLGLALAGLGRLDDAIAAYRVAIRLKPGFVEARSNLGNALTVLGRFDEAVAAHRSALALQPDYAEGHSNLGNALRGVGRLDEAVTAYSTALHLKPDFADAYCNLGATLQDLGRHEEALAACASALRLKPDLAEAYANLGSALWALARFEEASAAYAAALRLKPDFATAQLNDATTRLLLGDFASGWAKYEWRWRGGTKHLKSWHFDQPHWRGEDLAGAKILLHAEQGLGDAIQFCRYAPLVAARGGRVILEAPRPLLRLFSDLAGVERLVAAGDPLPAFEYHCPLMSLAALFGTDLTTIPPPAVFSGVDLGRIAAWRDRLGHDPGFRIGIVWQGNPRHEGDRWRSIPLHCFAPLARVAGVRLISLQKGHGLNQLNTLPEGMSLVDLGPDYASGDFAETAAILSALDLVVTIDSAVAHLAGTLERPTWVALPFIPDWRWLLDREDSPWYPSLRLFRQSRRGDWGGVFERMATELTKLIGAT